MYGNVQQPRRHKVKVDTPELTQEQKATASEVKFDARYMDKDDTVKALFSMSPTCMQRLQSVILGGGSDGLKNCDDSLNDSESVDHLSDSDTEYPYTGRKENPQGGDADSDLSRRKGLGAVARGVARGVPPRLNPDLNLDGLQELAGNLSGDMLDDSTDKLMESKNKTNSLSSVYTLLSTHDVFRRSMLRSVDWKIESCFDCLLNILCREKSLKGDQSIKNGTTAAKLILLLLWCMRKQFLISSLSGSLVESLVKACLLIIPPIPSSTKNRAIYTKPAAQLIWLSFAILGTLKLFNITSEYLPDGSTVVADSVVGDCEMEWTDFLRLHADYLLSRKVAQINSGTAGDGYLPWKVEEVLILDGVFFALSCLLSGSPSLLSAVRSKSSGRYSSLIWKIIGTFVSILHDGGAEDFINHYAEDSEGLPGSSSEIALGLPNLLGLCYAGIRGVSPLSENGEDFTMPEEDQRLLDTLNIFCRKGTQNANKHLSRSLSREIVCAFRESYGTVESNELPKSINFSISRKDLLDCVSRLSPMLVLREVSNWSGLIVTADGWDRLFIAKCCKAFGGDHGLLTIATVFEDLQYFDALQFPADDERSKSCRAHDRALNKKYLKQMRQFHSDRKAMLRLT